MECVQWVVLSKLPGSYSFHIFQISKPRVIYFVNRFIWHVGVCRVCVYVCMCRMYVCVYTVWCKTRLKINLRLDTIISPVQFSSFSAQLVFFMTHSLIFRLYSERMWLISLLCDNTNFQSACLGYENFFLYCTYLLWCFWLLS